MLRIMCFDSVCVIVNNKNSKLIFWYFIFWLSCSNMVVFLYCFGLLWKLIMLFFWFIVVKILLFLIWKVEVICEIYENIVIINFDDFIEIVGIYYV